MISTCMPVVMTDTDDFHLSSPEIPPLMSLRLRSYACLQHSLVTPASACLHSLVTPARVMLSKPNLLVVLVFRGTHAHVTSYSTGTGTGTCPNLSNSVPVEVSIDAFSSQPSGVSYDYRCDPTFSRVCPADTIPA